MSPQVILALYSYKKEITYALVGSFFIFIVIPLLVFAALINSGVEIVSSLLVEGASYTIVKLLKPDGSLDVELPGPFLKPTEGVVTLRFGEFSLVQGFHTGVDIASAKGTKVKSFLKGKVRKVGTTKSGLGRFVEVEHEHNLLSVYGHLDQIQVFEGKEVKIGETLGTQGNTGSTYSNHGGDGTHLHFEIRRFFIPINPNTFIDF